MPNAARKIRALPKQMRVIGIGVDLIECARIQHSLDRFGARFLHRVFTEGEIEYSMSMKFPSRHLAARFAGKEAVAKAFGTGIGKAMGWRNIDIRKKQSGEPFLVFSGPRSEEHTSELQSLRHLVCRLLLEKKKRQEYLNSGIRRLSAALVPLPSNTTQRQPLSARGDPTNQPTQTAVTTKSVPQRKHHQQGQ